MPLWGLPPLAPNIALFPHIQAMPAFQGGQGACAQPWVKANFTAQLLQFGLLHSITPLKGGHEKHAAPAGAN